MIKLEKKSDCCGCAACVQRCPKQCISMQEDEEGFLYPAVDKESCIDCGLCEKVCPILSPSSPHLPHYIYAAKSKDEHIRKHSFFRWCVYIVSRANNKCRWSRFWCAF